MRIAASPSILARHPGLLPIPDEPGYVDISIILDSEWKESYTHRFRQLRFVVVHTLEDADEVLVALHYDFKNDSPLGGKF